MSPLPYPFGGRGVRILVGRLTELPIVLNQDGNGMVMIGETEETPMLTIDLATAFAECLIVDPRHLVHSITGGRVPGSPDIKPRAILPQSYDLYWLYSFLWYS